MSDNIAIRVEGVSKEFKLPHEKNSSVKGAFVNLFQKKKFERQRVLRDISFEVKKGEFFGIVGRNGSGKSTLLKLLAGTYSPSKGNIQVKGSLIPFIELGVGFNPELTGRENVFLNGALLGFSRKQMLGMYDDIVEFAELERFMDQRLKNYSSGMQVRLAFSIAIRARTDILLLDEVLAVGDAIFQQKCFDYFKQLKKEQKTVIFISHDLGAVREYCQRGILIDKGMVVSSGKMNRVANDYLDLLNKAEEENVEQTKRSPKDGNRWGTGDIRVKSIETLNTETNQQKVIFTSKDSYVGIKVKYVAQKQCDKPTYGITVTDASGQTVFQSNTLWSQIKTESLSAREVIVVDWKIPNAFNSGEFSVSPAVANYTGTVMYDWREGLGHFKIRKALQSSAIINTEHSIRTSKDTK